MDLNLFTILALVLLSGFFSAAEISLTSMTRAKVLAMVKSEKFGSLAVQRLKETPQKLLVSILVGNQVVNILATTAATIWAIHVFGEGRITGFIVIFTLILIAFGSIVPKALALGFAEMFSRIMAYPLLAFVFIIRPVTWFFEMIVELISKLLDIKERNPFSGVSENELESMIEIAAEEGVLGEEEEKFLRHILQFKETTVEEVMTQLKDIAAISSDIGHDDLSRFVRENDHNHFPVYEEGINNIRGIITLHDLLHLLKESGKKKPLQNFRSQAVVVPKTSTLIELFQALTDKKKRVAIVIDEFGQTIGLVALDDILQEITGVQVQIERPQPSIKKISRSLWEMDGDVRVSRVNEEMGIKLPYPDHQVMSLVILEELKRFPEVDEVVRLDGVDIHIKRIEKNVVKKLQISKRRKSD